MEGASMKIHVARPKDVRPLCELISAFAGQGLLLPRTEAEIRAHLDDFLVLTEGKVVAGCVSLDAYNSSLAEIRSLAVLPAFRGRGHGRRLLLRALEEGHRRRIARVFAVTHSRELFLHAGFILSRRDEIPEKMERDCRHCSKEYSCALVTVTANIMQDTEAFPILHGRSIAAASPA
jgi:amino-acid N-acetyltransferase